MGTFEGFYLSQTQHPMLLWLAAILALGFCLTRQGLDPSMRRYCGALGVLSLLDAWLTSNPIYGIGTLEGRLASAVPLFFVLAGDFRYLLFAGAGTARGRIEFTRQRIFVALGLTLVVPISTQVILGLLPSSYDTPRVMFLIYEVFFVALTLCLLRFHRNVRSVPWIARVSRFVIVYYGLWATADLIILATGSDLGFALRVVPNVLYYGGLIAVMGRAAPTAGASPSPSP
jgi:hypothetical protein